MAAAWFVVNNTATASVQFVDETTGLPTNTTGTPTVTVTASDGVTTYSTTAVQTNGTTYSTTFVPTALDTGATIKWTGTVAGATQTVLTYADFVGSWPVTIAALRSFRTEFADTSRYPYADLLAARVQGTRYLNHLLDTSVVPRFHRYKVAGRGLPYSYIARTPYDGTAIELPHWKIRNIRSVSVDGVATSTANLYVDYDRGIIKNLYVSPASNVQIEYEYGFDSIPDDGYQPLLLLITSLALPNTANPRAISIDADTGFHTMRSAQTDGSSGIPDVDAFVARHSRRPAFGIA